MLTYAAPKAARAGKYRKPLGQSFQTVIECGPGVWQLQRPGGKEEVTGIKELTMQEEGRGEESNNGQITSQSLQGRQCSWGQHMPPGWHGEQMCRVEGQPLRKA